MWLVAQGLGIRIDSLKPVSHRFAGPGKAAELLIGAVGGRAYACHMPLQVDTSLALRMLDELADLVGAVMQAFETDGT